MNQLVIINQDYQFNYVLIGDRHKPVILFLHGFMGNSHDFSGVVGKLGEFCCLIVDLPGHGQTEVKQDTNYHMPSVAEALIGLLDKLAIKQCRLWGYSMGGRIALYLIVYFPQYFQSVILESASPGLKTQEERDRRIAQDFQLARQLESGNLYQFIQQWYNNPLFKSFVQHPNYQQAFSRRLDNDPLKLAKSLRFMGLGMQPALWSYLSKIQIPLILVVGALDAKFIAINQKIISLCPQASLNIVKHSGHNVHFEQPSKLRKLIGQLPTRLS
ncbi:MAG: 2-succinyl-6-hydroxy-2,4-cyclohexadiene-1-carboxylate synthase [Waterburya sp.]